MVMVRTFQSSGFKTGATFAGVPSLIDGPICGRSALSPHPGSGTAASVVERRVLGIDTSLGQERVLSEQ